MSETFKPKDYNSLSPYLIVDDAENLVELLKVIFNAKELRRFNHDNGRIAHIELKLDDSVLMISNSTDIYPAHKTMLHYYVPNVFKTFHLAIENGCKIIEAPFKKKGESDVRGSFYDLADNYWSIASQKDLKSE
ncbi:VOC family protein [Brumimicrobium glaciale]|uniref:VOC family protein n=1 Tax=Brumimicrobium glaciale TaxID=200475 RepID=A0A4Q4KEG1_9FLAO|nr:VOC family protein [Brumimicrobium glaciale]RYM31452.1 VOC family protein [Brumimicrobium glaciale]